MELIEPVFDLVEPVFDLVIGSIDLYTHPHLLSSLDKYKSLTIEENYLHNFDHNIKNLKILYLRDIKLKAINITPNLLEKLVCKENMISNINFNLLPNLITLNLSQNYFKIIPESINTLVNLKYLNLSFNKIKVLPNMSNLVNLKVLELDKNKITNLPILPNSLKYVSFYGNRVKTIENVTNLIKLKYLNISDNQISILPENMSNLKKLTTFLYKYNNITSNKIILNNTTINMFYSDSESIHNSNCQDTLRKSILALLEGNKYNLSDLTREIENHKLFDDEFKDNLLCYCCSPLTFYVTDNIRITFGDLLCYVWYIIQNHIKKKDLEIIFYDVVKKSKCFVSWITNIVIVLTTFVDNVAVMLPDPQEIGNIIINIKNKLVDYTVTKHKELAHIELLKKGIPLNIIDMWLSYIE